MKKLKNLNKQKKTIIYGVALLAIVSLSFLTYNFIAKGATYGWLQATWSGGADTVSVANHTSNQSGWTKFFSKDTNVVAGNTLTLSAGTSNVTDTTTAQFDAGTKTPSQFVVAITANNEIKLSYGYNASGICGSFYVMPIDRVGTTDWSTAMSYCYSLCPTCDLPTVTELTCICNNKSSFGNFTQYYWSATGSYYRVNFSDCSSVQANHSALYSVRCIRR